MVEIVVVYLLLGALAGLVAGLLGVGGGVVIVPVLVVLFQAQGFDSANIMHLALGTSLATIAITSLSSMMAHHRLGSLHWHTALWLAPGLVVGALLGALLADQMASVTLQRLFGLFEVAVALYMLLGKVAKGVVERVIAVSELMTVGLFVGTLSSLLGIGGGSMTVPYLSWRGRSMREAVAVSSAAGFPIAIAGGVGYLFTGLDATSLPSFATGYLYWPAFIAIGSISLLVAPHGARLAHRLPVARLKQLFAVVLLLIGLAMLLKA